MYCSMIDSGSRTLAKARITSRSEAPHEGDGKPVSADPEIAKALQFLEEGDLHAPPQRPITQYQRIIRTLLQMLEDYATNDAIEEAVNEAPSDHLLAEQILSHVPKPYGPFDEAVAAFLATPAQEPGKPVWWYWNGSAAGRYRARGLRSAGADDERTAPGHVADQALAPQDIDSSLDRP
jgi:hypothetical protein